MLNGRDELCDESSSSSSPQREGEDIYSTS